MGPAPSQRSEGRSIFLTIVTGLGLAGVGMVLAMVLAIVIGIFVVEHMHGGSGHSTPGNSQVSSTEPGSTQDPQPTNSQSPPTYPGLTPGNGTLSATKIPTN